MVKNKERRRVNLTFIREVDLRKYRIRVELTESLKHTEVHLLPSLHAVSVPDDVVLHLVQLQAHVAALSPGLHLISSKLEQGPQAYRASLV